VYDLQEPFRWIADVAVMEAFEGGVLDVPSFYFTGDDYRYRFEPEAKRRFLDLLREQFNSGVMYCGKRLSWDTVILRKGQELARYLSGKMAMLDLSTPKSVLERSETHVLREKILNLSITEAKTLGLCKSTVHYLRKRAREKKPYSVYAPVLARLKG
jgi:CRISPR-associated protein Cas1